MGTFKPKEIPGTNSKRKEIETSELPYPNGKDLKMRELTPETRATLFKEFDEWNQVKKLLDGTWARV